MNKTNLKISVIIACYNQEKFIAETLDSLLAQSNTNWECIVVDDGSTDGSASIIKQYCNQDERINYIYQKNGKQAKARNTGLDNVTGDLVQFLDADDTIEPAKLQQVVTMFEMRPELDLLQTDFVFGDHNDILHTIHIKGRNRVKLKENAYSDLLLNWDRTLSTPIHTYTYSRDFLSNNTLRFDETLPAQEDFKFHITVWQLSPKNAFIDEVLCRYRIGHGSTTGSIEKMTIGTFKVLNDTYEKVSVYRKFLIIRNASYRLAQILVDSLKTQKNLILQTINYIKPIWKENKTTIYWSLIMIPFGVIDKIYVSLWKKLTKQ